MNATSSPTSALPLQWPNNKRVAVCLTFDDGVPSQIDIGMDVLNRNNVRGTFYVTLRALPQRIEGWKAAVAKGHEIGNHTMNHPCTGNFGWSRTNALEDYTLPRMEAELVDANREIQKLLGVTPTTFAYPCGLTFIGRGLNHQSYVPLVAKHFLAGRGFRNESVNVPAFCDLPTVGAFDMDCMRADYLIDKIKSGAQSGDWINFAGHHIGDDARQTVNAGELDKVCKYCQDPANGVWINTLHNVATYVKANRK